MESLNVLALSCLFPTPADPLRGIFVQRQLANLVTHGCSVRAVSPVPYAPGLLATNKRRAGYRRTPAAIELGGVAVDYPRYLRLPGAWFHPLSCHTLRYCYGHALRDVAGDFQPDILHAHRATPDGYAALLSRRRYAVPLVLTLHGSDIDIFPLRDPWTRRLTREALSEADQVIAVSRSLKHTAERLAEPRREIQVVHLGVDLVTMRQRADERELYRKRLSILGDSPVMLFVGHLARAKGVFDLLMAFKRISKSLSDAHLIVVGDGPGGSVLMESVREAGLATRVHLVGSQPHSEIPAWLSAADMLVLPSYHEGLPNVVLEAMACERPVVATSVGGIPEVVEHGKTGLLVARGDVSALSTALVDLCRDPEARDRMGVAGRRVVESSFTWEQSAWKTIAVYREVLSGR